MEIQLDDGVAVVQPKEKDWPADEKDVLNDMGFANGYSLLTRLAVPSTDKSLSDEVLYLGSGGNEAVEMLRNDKGIAFAASVFSWSSSK
jgi:hypothetical protein